MVVKQGWIRAAFIILTISGFLFVLVQDTLAETNCAKQKAQATDEQSAPQVLSACSHNAAHCSSCPEPGCRPITGFLAFGCRLNYRLTNWVLSDKCDIESVSRGCPHASACPKVR
ncbi:hypothetical protein HZA56_21080 [Candidatus Poribacteria bacterium]|nr:hypothetical protein [Candidatus Poribacteria bacterium]